MVPDSTGGMIQGKDQTMDEPQVRAILNDITLKNPVIVISGDRNTSVVCQMPHKYNVLGWYKPTSVWPEKTLGKGKRTWTTVKYRLERLSSSEAWHAPEIGPALDFTLAGALVSKRCTDCHQIQPQVYLNFWTCMNASCVSFWKLGDGQDAPSGRLDYNPAFLLSRTTWDNEEQPYSVVPPHPDFGKEIGDNLTYINTRGVVCPECGRCNQRYLFKGWKCDAPGCSWSGLWPQHSPIIPKALHAPWGSSGYGPALGRNAHESGVNVGVRYSYHYKIYTYTFPGISGSFVHAVANDRIKEEVNGPNDMLAELQMVDMGLERRRFGGQKVSEVLATPKQIEAPAQLPTPPMETRADPESVNTNITAPVESGDFMTAFSMNYGMPYKFVASGASRSFEDERTPSAVRNCRSRLEWAANEFLPTPGEKANFNEELIFAYMEGQKIEYHDDGEEGLGSKIAALSLGGSAKMHMRLKAKHQFGCSKTGLMTSERPVPGSTQYEKRLRLWQELQPLKETDKLAYQRRIKEIPKELGIFAERNKNPKDLVTVTFGHGDIVLMEGYDIQKYLEHKVAPEGHLRFALTCRTVLEHHLKEHERPTYAVGPDTILYDGYGLCQMAVSGDSE